MALKSIDGLIIVSQGEHFQMMEQGFYTFENES
jgi:hypothetical protein